MHISSYAEAISRFTESQLLDMRWLDGFVSTLLWRSGLDPASPLGETSQLIVCNTARLSILLIVLSIIRGILDWHLALERCRSSLFGGGFLAALTGAFTGASLPKSAESSLPSRLTFLLGRGMAPEAAAALLFAAPFPDPLTALVVMTMAFGMRNALLCTLSGGVLAVLAGMLIGRIWRLNQRFTDDTPPIERNAAAGSTGMPRLRTLPGKILTEINYIFPYIILGAGSAAFIRNWVPESWVQSLLGTSAPWAVCLAVVAGIPFGADLFCMLPIVVELQSKGAHPGVLTAFILSATAFTPSALFAFKRAVEPKLLLLIYAACLIWAAGIGCLPNAFPELFR